MTPKKQKHEFTNFSVLQNGFLNPLKWKNKTKNVLIHHEGFKMLSSLFAALWIRVLKNLWICDVVFLCHEQVILLILTKKFVSHGHSVVRIVVDTRLNLSQSYLLYKY